MCAQIIEDEQRRTPDLIKASVKSHSAGRAKSCPEMIQ
jgi:hypothetical protein